jgi:transposase InsO family protein
MCRVFAVSSSGFYAWVKREPSAHAIRDAEISARIRMYHARSRGRYGAPNIHADLRDEGIRVGKKRVARLMAAEGLQGACYRKWVTTTTRDAEGQSAVDLVQRQFSSEAPNRLWVVPTSPTSRPALDSCFSQWCSTPSAAKSSAGRWLST